MISCKPPISRRWLSVSPRPALPDTGKMSSYCYELKSTVSSDEAWYGLKVTLVIWLAVVGITVSCSIASRAPGDSAQLPKQPVRQCFGVCLSATHDAAPTELPMLHDVLSSNIARLRWQARSRS